MLCVMNKSHSIDTSDESDDSRDYQRIASALEYLEAHAREQPSLAAIAEHVNLSEFHFQRLFRRWAGISPKRFLQYLTLAHTQDILKETPSLLDASLEAGLSGPGRLHELFVSVLGMTPAEARDEGSSLTITWGIAPSPFGPVMLAATRRGLCNLEFLSSADSDVAHTDVDVVEDTHSRIASLWPGAVLVHDDSAVAKTASRIFDGLKTSGSGIVLHVRGTNFQIRVWEALLSVPSGHVLSYEGLARHLGMQGGARAVASAVAKNPVGYLIPCHRVIKASGVIGEYRWGGIRKQALIGWENAQNAQAQRA